MFDSQLNVCFQGMDNNVEEHEELVQLCVDAIQKCECPVKKALEIMCSVGRLSYELSRHFDQVSLEYST